MSGLRWRNAALAGLLSGWLAGVTWVPAQIMPVPERRQAIAVTDGLNGMEGRA